MEENFDYEACLKEAEKGNEDAIMQIAKLAESSFYSVENDEIIESPQELATAINWYLKLAEKGDFGAMLGIIRCCKEMEGNIFKNADEIVENQPAENIYEFATMNQESDFDRALELYKKSAALGYERAQLKLDLFEKSDMFKEEKTEKLLGEIVKLCIADCFETELKNVIDNAYLEDDLGGDELDIFELIYIIEEHLGISIPDEELTEEDEELGFHFKPITVKDLIEHCKKQM